jgi:hypothetical protein
MTIAVVQTASTSGSPTSGSPTQIFTFGAPVTEGNTLVMAVGGWSDNGGTVPGGSAEIGGLADNWALAKQFDRVASPEASYAAIWWDTVCAGGSSDATFTWTGMASSSFDSGLAGYVWEVSGLGTATIDVTDGTSGGSGSSSWNTGSGVTSATASEIWFACVGCQNNAPAGPASPWASYVQAYFASAYQITTSTGTARATGAIGGSGSQFASALITLQGAGNTTVPGSPANVAVAAGPGFALASYAAAVTIAAQTGVPAVSIPGSAAQVAVTGYSDGVPGISCPGNTATVTAEAPAGYVEIDADIAGEPAQVTAGAPAGGTLGGGSVQGSPATVSVAAPAGYAEVDTAIAGSACAVTAEAPAGSVGIDFELTGEVATVAVQAPFGYASIMFAAASTPNVNVLAEPGTAVISIPGTDAQVTAAAVPGGAISGGYSLAGEAATVTAEAPAGIPVITVPGSASAVRTTAGDAYLREQDDTFLEDEAGNPLLEFAPATVNISEAFTGEPGAVNATAEPGTPGAALTGQAATVSTEARAGTVHVASFGSAATVAVEAQPGYARADAAVAGSAASVTAAARAGSISVSSNVAGSAATVSAAAPAGSAEISRTFAGSAAAVTAEAQPGSSGVSVPGNAATVTAGAPAGAGVTGPLGQPARVLVTAGDGSPAVAVSGSASTVRAVAPAGVARTDSSTVAARPAAATVAAPGGTVTLSKVIPGQAAVAHVMPTWGEWSIASAGQPAQVAMTAPAGTVRADCIIHGSVAAVRASAPAGAVHVSETIAGQPAAVTAVARPGGASISARVAGSVARVLIGPDPYLDEEDGSILLAQDGSPIEESVPGYVTISVAGSPARVAARASTGTPKVTLGGQAPGVVVAAGHGGVAISVGGSPCRVTAAAPGGTGAQVVNASVAGQVAAVAVQAPSGQWFRSWSRLYVSGQVGRNPWSGEVSAPDPSLRDEDGSLLLEENDAQALTEPERPHGRFGSR